MNLPFHDYWRFLWSLLGIFLMGAGFPKCYFTERKWPKRNPLRVRVQEADATWGHNCKDDFTDDMLDDKEWWIKFMGFWLLFFITMASALLIAVCVQLIVL